MSRNISILVGVKVDPLLPIDLFGELCGDLLFGEMLLLFAEADIFV